MADLLVVPVPSVLRCCWLGGRKGIQPVKTERWGAGMVICLELGADLHMAQMMSLPLTVSCFSKIQIGFTFLVLAHPGSSGKRTVERVCVFVFKGTSEERARADTVFSLKTNSPQLALCSVVGQVRWLWTSCTWSVIHIVDTCWS